MALHFRLGSFYPFHNEGPLSFNAEEAQKRGGSPQRGCRELKLNRGARAKDIISTERASKKTIEKPYYSKAISV